MRRLRLLLNSIKFEHSIFALPFAYIGMVLAGRGLPAWDRVLWITVAMVGARTLSMGANRLIDVDLDALNPRTAGRALPSRLLKKGEMLALCAGGLVGLLVGAWALNPLCLQLSPIAVVVLVGYPYTKRFTWASHAVLGLADGMAPAGGWLAVTGSLDPVAVVLAAAVGAWVGGFDLIYACQDVEFDRTHNLHSFPARFGVEAALKWSTLSHIATVALLAWAGAALSLSAPFWVGLVLASGLLLYEHRLVKPNDLSRLDMAFFNMNGYVAVVVFAFTVLAVYV